MSDRKRVLICGVLFGYGGLEGHFLDLGRLLVENGAEVTFATRVANPDVLRMPVWREAPFNVLTTPFIQRGGRFSTAWAMRLDMVCGVSRTILEANWICSRRPRR